MQGQEFLNEGQNLLRPVLSGSDPLLSAKLITPSGQKLYDIDTELLQKIRTACITHKDEIISAIDSHPTATDAQKADSKKSLMGIIGQSSTTDNVVGFIRDADPKKVNETAMWGAATWFLVGAIKSGKAPSLWTVALVLGCLGLGAASGIKEHIVDPLIDKTQEVMGDKKTPTVASNDRVVGKPVDSLGELGSPTGLPGKPAQREGLHA